MAEIDFDYDFGFDESKDIFKQREEILENYTKHFSSMNVFDHFNLLKQLAPNDRFPELEKCGDAGKKYIKHIEGMIQDYNSGKLKVEDRDLGRFWDVVHAAEVSLGDSRAFKKCDSSLHKRLHDLVKNNFKGLDYDDLEAFSNFPNEEYRPGLFKNKIQLKDVWESRKKEETINKINELGPILRPLKSAIKKIEQMPGEKTDADFVKKFQEICKRDEIEASTISAENLEKYVIYLSDFTNDTSFESALRNHQLGYNNEEQKELLTRIATLGAMTKTYEDHQKAEAQNQTTMAESAATPPGTQGDASGSDDTGEVIEGKNKPVEDASQDAAKQAPNPTNDLTDKVTAGQNKNEENNDAEEEIKKTPEAEKVEQPEIPIISQGNMNEKPKIEIPTDDKFNVFVKENQYTEEDLKNPDTLAKIIEQYKKVLAEEEAHKEAEEETKAAEEDARTKQEEDNPVITAEEEKDAPHSKDSDWHTAQEEKVKKYCESNGSSYEIIPTDDHSFAYNLSPSEEKKKEGLTDLTIKHTTPDYMIVNGKDGHIPSVEDFKSLIKDMPEINLGIAEDKYAARLMVAQLENGGQIHNVPKLSKLKDAEPEMMEKLQKMKQKSFEEKKQKWTAARIRELRGLSLAQKAATMNDEDYRKFKESPEYLKLKEAEEKSGTPQYTDLMDKARLNKDSEEYKKLSDEDKAKVDKVHESVAKLDKNEARKKIMEARGVVESFRTAERNGEGSDAKVETKLKDNADRNKYNDAMKLIKQNAAERQFR